MPTPGVGSIHYALGRSHWGAGLMTEAVDAVCRWATDVGSARVLEKCGFQRVGSAFEVWEKDAAPLELHVYRREA
jgi:RimJ/RimL family protein N-acetyltransferase